MISGSYLLITVAEVVSNTPISLTAYCHCPPSYLGVRVCHDLRVITELHCLDGLVGLWVVQLRGARIHLDVLPGAGEGRAGEGCQAGGRGWRGVQLSGAHIHLDVLPGVHLQRQRKTDRQTDRQAGH